MNLRWGISKTLCFLLLVFLSAVANAGTISVTYYHNDATGSPVAATNAAGEVIWRKDYTPYGEASGKDGNNRRGYTGHVEEQNGLVYAGARYYNPDWGRFLSVDPAGFSEGNPASFNRYAYANNNPYKYVDPDGRIVETVWDVANVVMDVSSMGMNLAAGNYSGAAVDAAGLIFDGAATIIPGMPGGAGVMIKSKRAADKLADAAKIKKGSAGGETAGKAFPTSVKDAAKAENPGATCVYCLRDGTATQVDHAVSRKNGGNATLDNAQLACPHCNASKGAGVFPKTPPPGYVGPFPPKHW